LTIEQELGHPHGEGGLLVNLGNAYYFLKNYKQAIQFYQKGLNTLRRLSNHHEFEANALEGMGRAYEILEQYSKRLNTINKH
jgi:tetratricopeptide (TPR) repeat protein